MCCARRSFCGDVFCAACSRNTIDTRDGRSLRACNTCWAEYLRLWVEAGRPDQKDWWQQPELEPEEQHPVRMCAAGAHAEGMQALRPQALQLENDFNFLLSTMVPEHAQVSTRILGRRTAPFPPFLIDNRVPRGFYQDPINSTDSRGGACRTPARSRRSRSGWPRRPRPRTSRCASRCPSPCCRR